MPVPDFSPGEVLTAAAMDSIGLWHINTTTFTNEASKVIDNVFSASYTNYKIVVQLRGSSNSNILFLRLINSTGTERATNYYSTAWGTDYASGPTTLSSTGARTTDMALGYIPSSAAAVPLGAEATIINPWDSATNTVITGTQTGINSGVAYFGGVLSGVYSSAERHRGFWVRNSANTNMNGTVSVYGYRV